MRPQLNSPPFQYHIMMILIQLGLLVPATVMAQHAGIDDRIVHKVTNSIYEIWLFAKNGHGSY